LGWVKKAEYAAYTCDRRRTRRNKKSLIKSRKGTREVYESWQKGAFAHIRRSEIEILRVYRVSLISHRVLETPYRTCGDGGKSDQDRDQKQTLMRVHKCGRDRVNSNIGFLQEGGSKPGQKKPA